MGTISNCSNSHSLHYHKVNVFDEQNKTKSRDKAKVENILEIPKADRPNWSVDDINREIENNAKNFRLRSKMG